MTVLRIKQKSKSQPEYLQKLFDQNEHDERVTESCLQYIESKKASRAPIWSLATLRADIMRSLSIEVAPGRLRKLLSINCNMSFKRIKRLPVQINSERCLVLRSVYAHTMLHYLYEGYRIINIDESWLQSADCRLYKWGVRGKANTLSMPMLSSKINVIAAIDTNGQVYLSMLQPNVDTDVFFTFMWQLVHLLDSQEENWRARTLFQLDGATYHRNQRALAKFKALGIKVIVSAPYSFDGAPVEKFFAHLKRGRLDTGSMKTGRKNFRAVATMLIERASTLSRATVISLWTLSTKALVSYLTYNKV